MYRVEKSKDCNRSGEALSILDLEQLRLFITSTTPVKCVQKYRDHEMQGKKKQNILVVKITVPTLTCKLDEDRIQ